MFLLEIAMYHDLLTTEERWLWLEMTVLHFLGISALPNFTMKILRVDQHNISLIFAV